MTPTPIPVRDLDRYVRASRKRFEKTLGAMVREPTVSMDPARKTSMKKGARAVASILGDFGVRATVVPTGGHPAVLGRLEVDRRAPWIGIYNHMDVQPADEPEWTMRDPFSFRVSGDRYLGRGTTDDKGPGLTALFAARWAADQGMPLNYAFLWEFEEEIGSPNFHRFLERKKKELRKLQSVVVSDTVWLSRTRPATPYGLRGLAAMTVRLRTGERVAHSGLTGGAARNPVAELAWLATQCADGRTGAIRIPEIRRSYRKPSAREIRGFLASGFRTEAFRKAHGFKTLRTKDPAQITRRIWAEPTFEVHGIAGGYQGEGVKTVVPHEAELKVSCRLVPPQDPDRIFRAVKKFVKERIPDAEVTMHGGLRAYLAPTGGALGRAIQEAYRFGFGKPAALIREGGSIGAVVTMEERLGCPVVFLGLSLPEHGYHAPNEFYDWGQASGGIRAFVKYFAEVAAAS